MLDLEGCRYSLLLYCYDKCHGQKTLEKRLYYILQVLAHHSGKPKEELSRNHGEAQLTGLLPGSQAHLPRGGIAHSRPGPPASIRDQEDAYRLGHGSG